MANGRLITATLLVTLTALIQGDWSGRWTTSDKLQKAVDQLKKVPTRIGDWEGHPRELAKTPASLNRRQLEIGEVAGYVARDYTNRRDGGQVMVLLVCGRPGPIAVHTPDICYEGIGYTAPKPHQPAVEPAVESAQFTSALFRKPDAPSLQIFWTWNDGHGWQTPDNPRLTFAPAKALYKLYIVRAVPLGREPLGPQATQQLLQQFLPTLDHTLFPNPEQPRS